MTEGRKIVSTAKIELPIEVKSNLPFMGKHWLFQHSEALLGLQFNTIISYLESSAEDIAKREKEIEVEYQAWQKAQGDDFDAEEAYDLFESSLFDHAKFSELLNNSTLVTIYSVFESSFYYICYKLKIFLSSNIDVKDLRGPGNIGQCRNYVEKVGNVNLKSLNDEWSSLRKYQLIRNKIVHDNSRIKDAKQDMVSFINSTKGIELSSKHNSVKITSIEFLKGFVELSMKYLIGVNEEIIKQTS